MRGFEGLITVRASQVPGCDDSENTLDHVSQWVVRNTPRPEVKPVNIVKVKQSCQGKRDNYEQGKRVLLYERDDPGDAIH